MNTQTCNSQNEIFRWENFSIYHCIRVSQFLLVFISPLDFEAFSQLFYFVFLNVSRQHTPKENLRKRNRKDKGNNNNNNKLGSM